MRLWAAAFACALAANPAHAQSVGSCDTWQANARNVDWSSPSKTFANGAIRLVVLDTEEPAAAAFHLMVLLPDPSLGYQICHLVSDQAGPLGFAGLDFGAAAASYDPGTGLTVTLPVRALSGDGTFVQRALRVTINQASGEVVAR